MGAAPPSATLSGSAIVTATATVDGGAEIDTTLAHALALGLQRSDPVRYRAIEALARRAAAHDTQTRAVIGARLHVLLERHGRPEPAPDRATAAAPLASTGARRGSPLAALLAQLARHGAPNAAAGGATARDAAPDPARPAPGIDAAPARLPALDRARRTWSRLSMDRRIGQSLAQRPENAGPLNSRQLVHRTLALLNAVSPDYLERLVAQLDDLAWLEDALKEAPRPRAAPRRDRPGAPGT